MLRSVACPSLALTGVSEQKCTGGVKWVLDVDGAKLVGFCRCGRHLVNL